MLSSSLVLTPSVSHAGVPISPSPPSAASTTKALRRASSHRRLPSRSPNNRAASRSASPNPPQPTPSPAPAPGIRVVPPALAVEDERRRVERKQQGEDHVFSLTDLELSEAYTFSREIGFGNWGSVWLCKRKLHNPGEKIAIKLVHRSKTPTTAARVRALWNEMKVLRSLPAKHPSLIDFEAFVITPSYALVTMPYCERVMPVSIPEEQAHKYFKGLIDGVRYLHENYVAHNDIKPANVLLSASDIPVLVDFGFATRWDPAEHAEPFISTISWGTPEYLSASRARGMRHDERTADVWSLGVTCFEILSGRTPFEQSEAEQFSSAEELEVYYARTLAGAWIGKWEMSEGMEELLKGMTHPVDSMRLTAAQAVKHHALRDPAPALERHRTHLPRPPVRAPAPPHAPLSPARPAHSRTATDSSDASGPREKKTASPPKKVVRTGAPAFAMGRGTGGRRKEEGLSFLKYEKSSDRLAAAAEERGAANEGKSAKDSSSARERLRAGKAVKVKVHTSPRKTAVASSPRRNPIVSTTASSRVAATSTARLASHRPTPSPSPTSTASPGVPSPSPSQARPDTSSASVSEVSILVEGDEPMRAAAAAPSTRASADALRGWKRPERTFVDVSNLRLRAAPRATVVEGGKENVHPRTAEDEKRRQTHVPSSSGDLSPDDSTRHARHKPVVGLSGMHEVDSGHPSTAEQGHKHQTFGATQSIRPSVSYQTLTPRVSEASLPSVNVAQASENAGVDTKLDRISLWVRNVDRLVEETRTAVHARTAAAAAAAASPPPSGPRRHKPSQSESYLSTPSKHGRLAPGSHVLSPSFKVTPSRTVLNGVPVFLPGGRGLADVPESISGSPALARSLSSPAHRVVGAAGAGAYAQLEGGRAYETVHFVGPPVVRREDEQPRSTRLKRSRSKLLALFQAAHDPKSDPALSALPTERLSFLKFPPPESAAPPPPMPGSAHAPIKHRSSLLRLKSIKNIRAALRGTGGKEKERERGRENKDQQQQQQQQPAYVRASQILVKTQHAVASRAPTPTSNGGGEDGRPTASPTAPAQAQPPPTPSSFSTLPPLTPRSPPPVALVPLSDVGTHEPAAARDGTLGPRASMRDKRKPGPAARGSKHHRGTPSLSDGLRSLFHPSAGAHSKGDPQPAFNRAALERERMCSGTPCSMASMRTDTTALWGPDGVGVIGGGGRAFSALGMTAVEGGKEEKPGARRWKGLSFGRKKKPVALQNPALEFDY